MQSSFWLSNEPNRHAWGKFRSANDICKYAWFFYDFRLHMHNMRIKMEKQLLILLLLLNRNKSITDVFTRCKILISFKRFAFKRFTYKKSLPSCLLLRETAKNSMYIRYDIISLDDSHLTLVRQIRQIKIREWRESQIVLKTQGNRTFFFRYKQSPILRTVSHFILHHTS